MQHTTILDSTYWNRRHLYANAGGGTNLCQVFVYSPWLLHVIRIMKQGISGVVIAYNESERIASCVERLMRVCDEVIVVDSFSTDNTIAIAESMGCRVLSHEFKGHIEQKNWAQRQSTFSWILSLDADEVLSDGLVAWMLNFRSMAFADSQGLPFSGDGYLAWSFPRLNHLRGRAIRGCGWYPDRKIRLWRSGMAYWGGNNPHDRIILGDAEDKSVLGAVGKCEEDILHYTYNSYEEVKAQALKFAAIGGDALREKREFWGILWIKSLVSPVSRWLKNYWIRGGFLYGKDGWIICYCQFLETHHKYRKALVKSN